LTPEEILTKKKIRYNPKGRDLLVRCLNPEHEDKNPSMRIDKITGVFQCWSCGFKGNLFQFYGTKGNQLQIRRQRTKDLIAEKLAESVGLDIPINAIPFQQEWRGISGKTYKHFEAFQHSDPIFAGRIVFPIRNPSGRIAAFSGRHMTQGHDPKYLIYPNRAKLPLFPHDVEPIEGRIILVEGLFDMLNLWDKGLKNAVCAFGTRTLLGKESKGPERLELLRMKGVYGIDIFFDNDDAGIKSAKEVRTMCEDKLEFDCRTLKFKDVNDPGDLTAPQVMRMKEQIYGENSFS
jgi:DNA primase